MLGTIPRARDTVLNTVDDVPSLGEFKLIGGWERRGSSQQTSKEINEIMPESALKKDKGTWIVGGVTVEAGEELGHS